MKIITFVGARPQFIKEAAIHPHLKAIGFEEIIVHSGQHYDANMSDIFFKSLNIKAPDINLNIGSGTHADMTGKIMIAFEKALKETTADAVITFGDTNSTLAAALVSAKLNIPTMHIEAGIRQLPLDLPEEINRRAVDKISNLLFAPSQLALDNLKKENLMGESFFVGDVMYDLFLKLKPQFDYDLLEKLGLEENNFVTTTLHRNINVDDKEEFEKILKGLQIIKKEKRVIFPLHPRSRQRVSDFGLESLLQGLDVIDPIGYLSLMGLTQKAFACITDSGGYQKECYFSGKQAVILMPDTGWRELTDCGWNVLTDGDNFVDAYQSLSTTNYPKELYGNGQSAKQIVDILVERCLN